VHELKHDGYRLQIHIRDGRVWLYTMNGADWSKRRQTTSASNNRADFDA
jgi:bifunctional non-homologous end joining protein LigD